MATLASDAKRRRCDDKQQNGTRTCLGENDEKVAGTLTTPITNGSSSSSPMLISGLPAAVWAQSLDLLTHDDLLHCSVASTFFLKEVSPLVGRIMVSPDASKNVLKYFPAKRFPNVKDVYVYNLISEDGDHAEMERDIWDEFRAEAVAAGHTRLSMADVHCSTMEELEQYREFQVPSDIVEDVVPLLENFHKLKTAFIGGLCTCNHHDGLAYNTHEEWNVCDNVRCDLGFNLSLKGEGTRIIAHSSLVDGIARAYYQGRLDERVVICGLLPDSSPCDGDEIKCPWKQNPGDYGAQSDDSPCKTCRSLCSFFPLDQLCKLEDYQVPCIGMQERIRIAARRDPKRIKQFLTEALIDTLSNPCVDCAGVISYDYQDRIERISFFVSRGANVKDPVVLKTLLEIDEVEPTKDGRIRMTEEAFQMLTGLGIAVTKADFVVVDRNKSKNEKGS